MYDNRKPLPVSLILITLIVLTFYITNDLSKITKNNIKNPFSAIGKTTELKIPILMYHYVEYNENEADYLRDQQNVPPHIFEQQILDLKSNGFTFITPKQLPKVIKKPGASKYVILSFDDGFRDFYTDAFPILKKHDVPAVTYLVYNFFGGADYMTEEMIQEITNEKLIEVGSHTLNHAYLPGIEDNLAESEISLSKKFLETKFNIEVESFAYPYGNYDDKTIKQVKKAGYTTAVTVDLGNIAKSTELFTLKRYRPGHLTGIDLINYISQ